CLLCEMLHALHCQDCCYENTNERERHRTKFTLGAGADLHVPRGICLATVFNWLRHRNEAPKSALHFGPGRYRLYWNRFHIGTGSRYPTLIISGSDDEFNVVSVHGPKFSPADLPCLNIMPVHPLPLLC